jgi:multidrug efflux pump subunit AcrA (membrane-fusion protein)
MYDADALVDATEDIVLKRSRRALDLTRISNQLARDRSQYRKDLELVLQTEQREEQVKRQTEDLARLTRQQALDAEARADAEQRSADALAEVRAKLERLQRDRERLALRAPRDGILLHGAARDYRPGRTPARYDAGAQLPLRQDLFLVADPTPALVTLSLNDGQAARFAANTAVRVETFGPVKAEGRGTLKLHALPSASSASEASYAGDVVVEGGLPGVAYGTRVRVVAEGGKP